MLKTIKYTGIWLQPLVLAFIYIVAGEIPQIESKTALRLGLSFLLSFLPTLYIWMWNRRERKNGKKDFHFLDPFGNSPDPDHYLPSKRRAMYPEVDRSMLYDLPTGIVLGCWKGKYVCKSIMEDGHFFILGGSGTGKSSCLIIPTLLANPGVPICALDIKGELSSKTCYLGDEKRLIFCPSDRSQYGYDPFYMLNDSSSQQDILETMQTISFSLVSLPADIKDPFWRQSARNLLMGLLIYYYNSGAHNLVDIMDCILEKPVKEAVEEACGKLDHHTPAYRFLVQFLGLEDQTLSGIFAELANHVQIFANDQNIRFAFRDNLQKLHPLLLEEGYSIYLSIKEEKLTAYYDVLQLIMNQVLGQLEKRPEDSHKVILLIDELGRLVSDGKLSKLQDGLKTLRSRQVIIGLCTQSTEGLSAYSDNEIADILSNCQMIAVLDASSLKTQKMIIEWSGKYRSKRKSWDGAGTTRKTSISYEDKDIVEPEDLMTLAQTGELILISPHGYNRITKVPYYKDPILAPLAEKIRKHNETINHTIKERR